MELQEKQVGFALLDNVTFREEMTFIKDEKTTSSKTTHEQAATKLTHVEKHKFVMLVQQEEQKSPMSMESPLTESGQWTDTGISTGDLSGKLAKPTTLEGLDSSNIDTEGDMSEMRDSVEMSPINNEEMMDHSHSTEDTTQETTAYPAVEESSVKEIIKETNMKEVSTSPMMDSVQTNDKAMSPMSQTYPECSDASTQQNIMRESCDVKLSPILFQQSAATSPIVTESKQFADAASSPPKSLQLVHTATSPTTEDAFQKAPSPEVVSESLDFEMSMTDDEISKTSEVYSKPGTSLVQPAVKSHEVMFAEKTVEILSVGATLKESSHDQEILVESSLKEIQDSAIPKVIPSDTSKVEDVQHTAESTADDALPKAPSPEVVSESLDFEMSMTDDEISKTSEVYSKPGTSLVQPAVKSHEVMFAEKTIEILSVGATLKESSHHQETLLESSSQEIQDSAIPKVIPRDTSKVEDVQHTAESTTTRELPEVSADMVDIFVEELVEFTKTEETQREPSSSKVQTQTLPEVSQEMVSTFVEELVNFTEMEQKFEIEKTDVAEQPTRIEVIPIPTDKEETRISFPREYPYQETIALEKSNSKENILTQSTQEFIDVTPEIVDTFVEELVTFTESKVEEIKVEHFQPKHESFESNEKVSGEEQKPVVIEEISEDQLAMQRDMIVSQDVTEFTCISDDQIKSSASIDEKQDIASIEEGVIITEVPEYEIEEVAEFTDHSQTQEPIFAVVSGDATLVAATLHERFTSRPSISEEVAQVLIDTQEEEFEEPLKTGLKLKYTKEVPEALILDEDQPEAEYTTTRELPEVSTDFAEELVAFTDKTQREPSNSKVSDEAEKMIDVQRPQAEVSEVKSEATHIQESHEIKKEATEVSGEAIQFSELHESRAYKADSAVSKVEGSSAKKSGQNVSELMKGEDINEFFVVMMPPGQTSFDVKDHDDTEFDESNAPRHSDEPSESSKLYTQQAKSGLECLEPNNSQKDRSSDQEDFVEPAIKAHVLHTTMAKKYLPEEDKCIENKFLDYTTKEEMIARMDASEVINTSIIKELGEEEQEESGFEVSSKLVKSMDESTTAEQSLDLLQSDKTDSLFQSSTLNESAQTLSEHTLDAELPSDYDTIADITINANDEITLQLDIDQVIDDKVDVVKDIMDVTETPDEVKNEIKTDFVETSSVEIKCTADPNNDVEISNLPAKETTEVAKQTTEVAEATIQTKDLTFVESQFHVELEYEDKHEDQEHVVSERKQSLLEDENRSSVHFDAVEHDSACKDDVKDDTSLVMPNNDASMENKVDVEIKSSRTLKDSVHVTTLSPSKVATVKEKVENVQLIPHLNWELKDKDKFLPSKESQSADVDVQGSLSQDQFGSTPPTDGSSEPHTASSNESSEPRTASSHESSSAPSSRMSERSGTQSSIELRSSSRSSHSTGHDSHFRPSSKSSSSAAAGEERMSGISESSGSPCQQRFSSSPYTEETTDESKNSSRPDTGSELYHNKKQVTVTDSAHEYPAHDHDDKSPTAQLRSSGEMSPQSMPSSPRHLRRTVSNGVKKLTSEIFSTDRDLSTSLEIVYSEPSKVDERRKLSERYRHTSSSSGASNGSVNNDQHKIEKRKASVTQIRKTPDELATGELQDFAPSGQESDDIARSAEPTCSTSDGEMKLYHSSEPNETKSSPIKEKKTASPTKIQAPAPASGAIKKKTCSEEFSPMLQVECKTPECKRASPKGWYTYCTFFLVFSFSSSSVSTRSYYELLFSQKGTMNS